MTELLASLRKRAQVVVNQPALDKMVRAGSAGFPGLPASRR